MSASCAFNDVDNTPEERKYLLVEFENVQSAAVVSAKSDIHRMSESKICGIRANIITNTIMNGLMNNNRKAKPVEKDVPKITRREKEVLDLIMDENTNQEIAGKLFISLKTVEAHRSNLLSKLNARNTAGLVKKAMEFKLAG